MTEEDEVIVLARTLGAQNIELLDEAIAYCLNHPNEEARVIGFARLQRKYHDIAEGYLGHRYPGLSATGKDLAADATFDKIWVYAHSGRTIRTNQGSLAAFVNLMCEWAAWQVHRTERRRRALLLGNFQESWCVQRDEADAYRGETVTDQEIDLLMGAIRQAVVPDQYPHTALVMEALSAIFVGSNGLQLNGRPRNPSVAAIKRYIDTNHGSSSLSEDEINAYLRVLRHRAKAVLQDYGWEIGHPASKYAQ
jgi:hypothetical protein